jgi:hypothetical protein
MDPNRVDFSSLDLAADPTRFERMVQAILVLAKPELAQRAAGAGPIFLVAQWARPMLAAAAVLATIAAGTLTLIERQIADPSFVVAPGVPEVLLPSPLADWVLEQRAPTVSDLLVALDDGGGP